VNEKIEADWINVKYSFYEMMDDLKLNNLNLPTSASTFIQQMFDFINDHDYPKDIMLEESPEISDLKSKIEQAQNLILDGELKLKSYSFMKKQPDEKYIKEIREKIALLKQSISSMELRLRNLQSTDNFISRAG
jgi:hypothetical protein